MKPLRIAIFTPTFLPKCSGAEIFHHNLAKEFSAMGHRPVVILPRSLHRRLDADLPYETTGFRANLWSYFKYSNALAFFLNRWALDDLQQRYCFDVWHTVVLSPSGVCFANWQSRRRIPGLIRAVGDDVQPVTAKDSHSHMQTLISQWIPQAQKIVSLSRDMTSRLESLGVTGNKIELIPNAVDIARFSAPADKSELRKKAGIPSDAFVFLCVARNHPQKDFPTLLLAFQKLMASNTSQKMHLVIAGRGVPQLRDFIAPLGIQDAVTLMEFTVPSDNSMEFPPQALVDIYRSADVFVLSSLLEGFSSALLEAMATGLPVAATRAPGIVDQVQSGVQGLLSECGNPDALAASMRSIMENHEIHAQFSRNSLSTAQPFSWHQTAEKYVNCYNRMIQQYQTASHLGSV